MAATGRESFVFYKSFYEAIKGLPADVRAEVYTAVMEYSLYGNTTEDLNPVANSIFTLIKPQLDANNKRFENGKKGGRPAREATGGNQSRTKTKPNANDNDNANDKEGEVGADILNEAEGEGDYAATPNAQRISVDWEAYKFAFNDITKKNIRVIDNKTKQQIKARLKEGYTKDDLITAIQNCANDAYHKETGLKYLTPEFITRSAKMQMYLNIKSTVS